jgi:sulfide:quinone oxidoreductase
MTTDSASSAPFEVLIAGGGVAALEGALALRDLAGGRVSVRLLAPAPDFVYRPMVVREPFAYSRAERYPLADVARDAGAELVEDALAAVDTAAGSVRGTSGSSYRYDALLVALGAQISPRYDHAITVDDRNLDELMHGLIQDVEGGYVKTLAIVVPPRMGWQLPAYELALMTANRARDMNVETAITIVTPEDAPLVLFGDTVSRAVGELLAVSGVEVLTSARAEIPQARHITVTPGDRTLTADRIIALPELTGPQLEGLPADGNGFIPVDPSCRVRGTDRVYAAGDCIDFPVKHGGLASQEADAAASAIAVDAGAATQAQTFEPVVHGALLTGGRPLYLRAEITGGRGVSSEVSDEPLWQPPTKIVAKYLAPYLEQRAGATKA